ncbi:23S rRNA (uracil(1939)-C(5))-methyltransferase RlmD [Eggerthella sp. NSJ-70]|uniref:23S rRNA (Uracil(1939)-C(5))-methyltransferase RlmD n=1 Tax=Eggerthella hominis TaxID=2763043 RepID=A0ABR7BVI9_9ACTN|nr:23S rRNA (uracil(1939)-C(5))-methyltransferase RlmD [Eggerthella hominis]MBC5585602.1 23S rRNA (uracil(1939)-C(5))-methyltransferase RlmD [Eggerthella hominis]
MPSSSSGSVRPAPRPASTASACPVERECGACQHIGVPYAKQLAGKDARVAALFADVADPAALRPIIGMDEPYHYRNKVVSPYAPGRKLQGGTAKRGQKPHREILCGMYAAGSHRIVPTDGCLIENEEAKRIIRAVRDLMGRFGIEPYREDAGSGFLRHAVVRVGHTSGEILVTLVTNGRTFPASRAFCRELVRRCPRITSVVQNVNERQTNVILGEREQTLYGPGFILDKLCGLSFRISSQSFYQVNAVQTEVLYERAIEMAGFTGTECAIDAYCGTGTIGLVAAKHGARQVIGVDTVASAVRDARENAKHNGVENAQFVVGDAGAFMRERAAAGEAVDVLLMDPPRAGASEEFLAAAATLAPQRIVYISCNPETQVRDLAFLRERGYAVRMVQPVDMFPHTDHVETIALVEREEGAPERSQR